MTNEIIQDKKPLEPGKKDENPTSPPPPPTPPKDDKKPEDNPTSPPPPADKVPAWVNPRIDQLTRKAKESDEARIRAEEKARALEAEIEKTKRPITKKPDDKPQLTAEQIEKLAEAKAAQKVFNEKCNTLYKEGKAAIPDFDEAIGSLNRLVDAPQLTAIYAAVLNFEKPHELLHHLSKEPTKIQEIIQMSHFQAGRELGRIADKLELERKSAVEDGKDSKDISKAPPPAKPAVDGKTSTPATKDLYDKNLKGKEWVEARNRDLAEKQKGQFRNPV